MEREVAIVIFAAGCFDVIVFHGLRLSWLGLIGFHDHLVA